jgi:hypothetical protein
VALFGAASLVALARRRPPVAFLAVLAMVALTASAVPDKVRRNGEVRDEYARVAAVIDDAHLDSAVLFLPLRGNAGFLDLAPFLRNRSDLDQPVLYAEDRGTGENNRLLAYFPDRRGYVLDHDRPRGSTPPSYRVRPL